MTQRREDINGWFEVKGNPISKVGVFDYSGEQIGAIEPNKIYKVYRPEEELSNLETIDSFKLLPLINDHEMLGSDIGGTPPEDKGIDGVIGEKVYFEAPFLKANIKVFSEKLRDEIEAGKVDLSCGYRCEYEFTQGEFEGEQYDAIQRRIRGNHLALVDEGRMGKEVVVLDHLTFTVDAKDNQTMEKEELLKKLAAVAKSVKEDIELSADEQAVIDALTGTVDEDEPDKAADNEETADGEETSDDDEQASDDDEAQDDDETSEDEGTEPVQDDDNQSLEDKVIDAVVSEVVGDNDVKAAGGMDAALRKALKNSGLKIVKAKTPMRGKGMDARALMAEISSRDKLANRLSNIIGTFDHSRMTTQDVANYGAKKLGLKAKGRSAIDAVEGYLAAAKRNSPKPSIAQDSRPTASFLNKYLEGSK